MSSLQERFWASRHVWKTKNRCMNHSSFLDLGQSWNSRWLLLLIFQRLFLLNLLFILYRSGHLIFLYDSQRRSSTSKHTSSKLPKFLLLLLYLRSFVWAISRFRSSSQLSRLDRLHWFNIDKHQALIQSCCFLYTGYILVFSTVFQVFLCFKPAFHGLFFVTKAWRFEFVQE